jgi:phosphoserine phosphatase
MRVFGTVMHSYLTEEHAVCLTDWDGTLRLGYTIQDWLPFLVQRLGVNIRSQMCLDEVFSSYDHGEITYEQLVDEAAMVHARAMNGLCVEAVANAAAEFVRSDDKLFKYTPSLLKYLKEKNITAVAVSGAPFEIISAYAKTLGISNVYSLKIYSDESLRYTSKIEHNFGSFIRKREIANLFSNNSKVVLALGNSIADAPLFSVASKSFFVTNDDSDVQNLRQNEILRKLNLEYITPNDMMKTVIL